MEKRRAQDALAAKRGADAARAQQNAYLEEEIDFEVNALIYGFTFTWRLTTARWCWIGTTTPFG